MTLEELDRERTFALLGPGFRDGRIAVFTNLRRSMAARDLSFALLAFEETAQGPVDWFTGDVTTMAPPPRDGAGLSPSPLDATGYDDAVAAIREAIHRGEVYQANYTRFVTLGAARGIDVFRALTRQGLAPYAC